MRFEFATANRILFGPGTRNDLARLAAETGRRPLVVTGAHVERAEWLLDTLRQQNLTTTVFVVADEPTVDMARAGVVQARQAGCDFVIGLGGGSVLDAGKAIAMLLTNGGDPLDYLEVVGRGKAITQRSAPYIAVPTTAGTNQADTRSASFCNGDDDLLPHADLWLHGHLHCRHDYRVGRQDCPAHSAEVVRGPIPGRYADHQDDQREE